MGKTSSETVVMQLVDRIKFIFFKTFSNIAYHFCKQIMFLKPLK